MKKEKIDKLIEAVKDTFDVDVMDMRRNPEIVNVRRCFYNLLSDQGMGRSEIGRLLHINHATIIHHIKKHRGYMETSHETRDMYLRMVAMFEEVTCEEAEMDRHTKLLKLSLFDEIKEAKQKIRHLNEEITFFKNGRLSEIIDLLSETVKEGTEEQVKKSIRTLMNGIYSY
jgi:predicted transcriptional regulator